MSASAGADAIFVSIASERGGLAALTAAQVAIARSLARLLAAAEGDQTPADSVRLADATARLFALLPALPSDPAVAQADVSRLTTDELALLDALQSKLLGTAPTEISEAELDAALPQRRHFPRARFEAAHVFKLEDELRAAKTENAILAESVRNLAEKLDEAAAKPAAAKGEQLLHAETIRPAPAPAPAAPSNVTPLEPRPGTARNIHNSPHAPVVAESLGEYAGSTTGSRFPWPRS